MLVQNGQVRLSPYWELTYPEIGSGTQRSKQDYIDEFRSLLIDATRLRLRSDVPVGAYLSGGLDSSTIAAIIRNHTDNHLDTFSISFSDSEFDESGYQSQMAEFLGTNHHVVFASHADIGRIFPDVIWHAETPIMRTSPAPMYLLSKLVQDKQFKVVLTGEGADEILAGYDIFKEAKVRRFWAQRPDSTFRPNLFKKIYPWISGLSESSTSYLAAFFGLGLTDTNAMGYSHAIRWRTTSRTKRFFSEDLKQAIKGSESPNLLYPENYERWDPLHRAEYLEISVFLSQYLLSSQSDRMAMAHSVEGRFPFLDHRVVEFCNNLPPRLKLLGLTEKYLLKEVSRTWLPGEICSRPKQPFRAPIHRSFFHEEHLDYVRELLSPSAITSVGLFNPSTVSHLISKLDLGLPLGETDDMALAGVLSTQLVAQQFISAFKKTPPISASDDVKVVVNRVF
jgi:asparagine synthase (glutamine-hydrolysing)